VADRDGTDIMVDYLDRNNIGAARLKVCRASSPSGDTDGDAGITTRSQPIRHGLRHLPKYLYVLNCFT
jgi:hypothetical protein